MITYKPIILHLKLSELVLHLIKNLLCENLDTLHPLLALWPGIQECPSATHLKILTEDVNHPGISHALFTVYTDFSRCSMEVCSFDTGPACIKAEFCVTILS